MSDYTPTTEDIRKMFPPLEATYVYLDGDWRHLNRAMFDRWLFGMQEDAWDRGYQAGVVDGSDISVFQPTAEISELLNRERTVSDYTPTTEAIRRGYSRVGSLSLQRKEAFDRWLGVVKAQAVAEWLAERMAAFEKVTLEDYEQGETE